jgi:hypothetical protein
VTRAQSLLLGPTDLPAGWKSFAPRSIDVGPDAGPAPALTACLQTDAALFRHDRPGHTFVSTPVFQSNEYVTLTESLDVAATSAAAQADFALLAKPNFPGCLGQAYSTVLTQELGAQGYHNVAVTAANGAPLALPAVGDRSAAFRASDTLVNSGQPEYVYVDVIVFQHGGTTGLLQFERAYSTVPSALEQQLMQKAASRVATA